jgi:hypothetical protein
MNELVRHGDAGWEKWKALALDSVTSPHSRWAYQSALDHFWGWYRAASRVSLSKAVVNSYKAQLEAAGLSASTIKLAAIRRAQTGRGGGRQRANPAGGSRQHRAGARRGPARSAPGELAGSPPGGTIDSGAPCRHARGQAGSRPLRRPDRLRIASFRGRGSHICTHPAAPEEMGDRRSSGQAWPGPVGSHAGLGQNRD